VTSRLERAHPLTPVAAALLLVVVAYAGPRPWGATLAVAVALALASWSGVGARVARLAAGVALPTWLLLALMNGVLAPGDGARLTTVGPLRVALDGIGDAAVVAARLAAAVAALGWMLAVVSPRRLTRALAERGMPAGGAYLLVASLEAVPQARRRASEVLDAQRCRGLASGGGPVGRVRALAPLAGPLVVSLVTEAEERALALDARGFDPRRPRTAMVPVADGPAERALRAAMWVAAAAVVAWRAWV
jgi:energy-coupling factor transport system permease protein